MSIASVSGGLWPVPQASPTTGETASTTSAPASSSTAPAVTLSPSLAVLGVTPALAELAEMSPGSTGVLVTAQNDGTLLTDLASGPGAETDLELAETAASSEIWQGINTLA